MSLAPRHPRAALLSVAPPKQARSQQTLYRLLDAAEALIDEKGLADVSVPEIVRRAGSSVGGFYARFRDKDELLRALEERFFQEMAERLDALTRPERWAGASIPEIVRPCVAELVGTFRERRSLIGAFVSRAARDPRILEDGLRFRRAASERVVALLRSRCDAIRHPDPELAVHLGVQLAFGLMHEVVVFGDLRVGSRTLSDADLERELTGALLSYLSFEDSAADERSRP